MAALAGLRKSRRHVIHRASLLKLLQVATAAGRIQPNINSGRSIFMTGVAGDGTVCSQQGKPILVSGDRLRCSLPSTDSVTALALRAIRASVEIRVTTRAFQWSLGKNFRDVARITRNIFVHASKRKLCLLIVIEFRLRPQRSPTRNGVAVLASDIDGSMRIPHCLCGARRDRKCEPNPHGNSHPSGCRYSREIHCGPFATTSP